LAPACLSRVSKAVLSAKVPALQTVRTLRCAAFREVHSPSECCGQPSPGPIGWPVPALIPVFRPDHCGFSSTVHPDLKPGLHPPASFVPPSKSCGSQPARLRGRLPWSFFPHRDVRHRRPPLRGFHLRGHVPSPAFRTPSTVCSANAFAGLFHPAATSRVCPSGVCPSPRSRTGFHRPLPSCPLSEKRLRFRGRSSAVHPGLQGLAPRDECGAVRGCSDPARSAPLLGFY